jgi:hypothetical protein
MHDDQHKEELFDFGCARRQCSITGAFLTPAISFKGGLRRDFFASAGAYTPVSQSWLIRRNHHLPHLKPA